MLLLLSHFGYGEKNTETFLGIQEQEETRSVTYLAVTNTASDEAFLILDLITGELI